MLLRELHLGKHEGRALDEQTRTALNSNLGDQNRTVLVAVFFGVAHELGLSPLPTTEGAREIEHPNMIANDRASVFYKSNPYIAKKLPPPTQFKLKYNGVD
ncbi:uncharacterized protein TNIN_110251 [Trichonephila inaurata madagascariensis]|uniref:Uncharacterized protein n=1 Tax=Trichonephila inaurata madagascariensis TaxID=2747483 RepID=A0A8X6YVS1_9ARAC|nr:uncharacterized protein TNIN_110251 [Trichonephila inaurata madagascariensis]